MAVQLSRQFHEKVSRIKKLPVFVSDIAVMVTKVQAVRLVRAFHRGIKDNDLSLQPLKPETIIRKMRQKMKRPEIPLYGRGDQEGKRAYSNMLNIRKRKKGYSVIPSVRMHHTANLKLKQLFYIHEFGATFKGATGKLIRIPPRPALRISYEQTMATSWQKEMNATIREAIRWFLQNGDDAVLKRAIAKYTDWDRYDE